MNPLLVILFTVIFLASCNSKPKAISIRPKPDPNLLRHHLDSGFQEDGDTAIALYTKVLSLDTANLEAFWRRGCEYHKTNRYENAILDFNTAIAIDSSFNVGYLFGDRGESKEKLGKLSEAITDYTTALRFCKTTEPSTPKENFYYNRARAKLKLGDTISATIDTDSALYFWRSFPKARYQRARLEIIKGNYQNALKYYTSTNDITPDMADDREFLQDVFYYGVLNFKTGGKKYCNYWNAAAKFNYPKATEYMSQFCIKK